MKLVFEIPPVAQARPRATQRRSRPGMKHRGGIMLYVPRQVKIYKLQLGMMCSFQYHDLPLKGPLSVKLDFYREIQSSDSKKLHHQKATGAVRPIVKPDVDNYVKSTLDGLNRILWEDDNQIVDLQARKFYSDHPRIEIQVEKL